MRHQSYYHYSGTDHLVDEILELGRSGHMLGLASLATLCRQVEGACRSNEDYIALSQVLRVRPFEAVTKITAMRAELASRLAE